MKRILGFGFAALLLGVTVGCTVTPTVAPNSPQANVIKDRAMTGQSE